MGDADCDNLRNVASGYIAEFWAETHGEESTLLAEAFDIDNYTVFSPLPRRRHQYGDQQVDGTGVLPCLPNMRQAYH
jgi:hypothetical protein